jgi:multidrug efflux pump subunit AcrA (membrane-fusion protein)
MKRYTVILGITALFAVFFAGYFAGRGSSQDPPGKAMRADGPSESKQIYTCSMHPQIRLDKPGNCPICQMPLIPADSGPKAKGTTPVLALSDQALSMAGVETTPVEYRKLSRDLRAVGKIQYNESSLATVTARVDGYAEKLFVNITGVNLKAGDHLADIYSPDLLLAQQELLIALEGVMTGPLVETAKLKLRRWGLTESQVQRLIQSKKITDRVTLYSPVAGTVLEKMITENSNFKAGDVLYRIANLDTVWAYLDIYEVDLPWIRYGQKVTLSAESFPGRSFTGMITFMEPVLNDQSRALRVPVHVENHDHALKPGMYVSAMVQAELGPDGLAMATGVEGKFTCPMHPQVLKDKEGSCPHCAMPLEKIPGDLAQAHDHGDTGEPGPTLDMQYACPMRCEGDKTYDQPGVCPICNMNLTPQQTLEVKYRCPMKCEGEKTYGQPGVCPVCNMHLEKVEPTHMPYSAPPGTVLAVPADAVLDSGTRKLVYVEKGHGTFEPREITTGPRSGAYFPVLAGLTQKDRVASRGGFLIDSQFQITGHPSLYYPGGVIADSGHGHGDPGDNAKSPVVQSTPSPNPGPSPIHQH